MGALVPVPASAADCGVTRTSAPTPRNSTSGTAQIRAPAPSRTGELPITEPSV